MAIKRQAEEAQAAMESLMAWQEEQKRKDAALRQAAATNGRSQAQRQPPIRGTAVPLQKASSVVQRGGPKVRSALKTLSECFVITLPPPPSLHALECFIIIIRYAGTRLHHRGGGGGRGGCARQVSSSTHLRQLPHPVGSLRSRRSDPSSCRGSAGCTSSTHGRYSGRSLARSAASRPA